MFGFQDFLAREDSNLMSKEGALAICISTSGDFEAGDAYPCSEKLELMKEELLVPFYISENDGSRRQHVTVFGKVWTRKQVFRF